MHLYSYYTFIDAETCHITKFCIHDLLVYGKIKILSELINVLAIIFLLYYLSADPEVDMEYCCGENEEVDLDLLMKNCQKHPGHAEFINILDFSMEQVAHAHSNSLPRETLKNIIIDHSVRTSRIRVLKTYQHNNFRTIKKFGTAYLITNFLDQDPGQCRITCPIEDCAYPAPHDVVGPLHCITAKHVFEDENEARNTELDFFLDNPKDSSSKVIAQCVEFF